MSRNKWHLILLGLVPVYWLVYMTDLTTNEDLQWWVALFSLAIVGVLALYYSSANVKALEEKYELIFASHQTIEERHQTVLSLIQRRIELSTRGMVRHRQMFESRPPEKITPDFIRSEMAQFRAEETLLLDAAQNLKDFLQIQSGRMTIASQEFKLDNVLKEIFGSLRPRLSEQKTELVYLHPEERIVTLKGDARRFEQIVRTMIEALLPYSQDKSLTVEIEPDEEEIAVEFSIEQGTFPEASIMQPDVALSELDGKHNNDDRVRLYIAYELVNLMGGVLERFEQDGSAVLRLQLPAEVVQTASIERIDCPYDVVAIQRSAWALETIANVLEPSCRHFEGFVAEPSDPIALDAIPMDALVIDRELLVGTLLSDLQERQRRQPFSIIVLECCANEDGLLPIGLKIDKQIPKPIMPDQWARLFDHLSSSAASSAADSDREAAPEVLTDLAHIHQEDFERFAHHHVLIAEDNVLNQKILRSILAPSGMRISLAGNGEEALAMLQADSTIDMVLMDANMPVLDGYDATRRIRERYSPEALPVIVIENAGFAYTDKHGVGFNAVLQKPFKAGQLYRAFELFGRAGDGRETEQPATQSLVKYAPKPSLLDIEAGIRHFMTAIVYRETLREALETFQESRATIDRYVRIQDHEMLVDYLEGLRTLAETIGAKEVVWRLEEVRQRLVSDTKHPLTREIFGPYFSAMAAMMSEAHTYLRSTEFFG